MSTKTLSKKIYLIYSAVQDNHIKLCPAKSRHSNIFGSIEENNFLPNATVSFDFSGAAINFAVLRDVFFSAKERVAYR